MAFVGYGGLTSPNEVLEKMAEYIQMRGYNIAQPVADDLNVFDMSYSDGKKFAFRDRTGDFFIILRSANGTQIFGTNDDPSMDITSPETNVNYTGIGMIVAEGYSNNQRWYNQFRVPKTHRGIDVHGVFMPMKVQHTYMPATLYHVGDIVEYGGSYYKCTSQHISQASPLDPLEIGLWTAVTDSQEIADSQPFTYTLYCNNVTTPTDSIVFSLVKENDSYRQTTHLVFGNIEKFEDWDGGAIFSGSSIKQLMGNDVNVYNHDITSDSVILPVLSSGSITNTFLRIDIDEAPTDLRGNILWASSGVDNITGKRLSMPIRLNVGTSGYTYGNGEIPHYYWLQSHARLDWGRNINTLNCITIDMPIFAAVCVDPDVLQNYAAVGNVSGIYSVSMLNMQTAGVYEKSYPQSGDLCQVFPHGKRRGAYGFDGISIKQSDLDT